MRVHNYYPGPGSLPLEALEQAQNELLDFQGTGMSLLETSHRAASYDEVHNESIALVREMLKLPENYHVMWLQAGATMQFAMIPMNLIGNGGSADYVMTGFWSERAFSEAKIVGKPRIAGSSQDKGYAYVPKQLELDPDAQYVHVTSNNTIYGAQFFDYPETNGVPLVCDMSSDIFWRFFDVKPFGIVYAGAHKNLGPAGATLVIMRDDILQKCRKDLPSMLDYNVHVKNNSLFNTPPTFTIYMVRNVLRWIKGLGGPQEMERINRAKAETFYKFIDSTDGFYNCSVANEDRSVMNAVFEMQSDELEKRFVQQANADGFIGLGGRAPRWHLRMTMYNAISLKSVQELVEFMGEFMRTNG
ncbi:MAG: 3-phosphoserine/phosphohydroxythreonine transaminase [Candidatus Alcyoniella australis]|nr:3-phosphoserine/phosphohydroxythreonine transaminase [Candidatus Alcyoniella australis]